MKRTIAVSLMLTYLAFSAGVVISYHFCGGKLDEIGLYKAPKSCCADANSDKSCCQNSTSVFRITDNYSNEIYIPDVPHSKLVAFAQKVFSLYNSVNSSDSNNTIDVLTVRHSSKSPIYLTNRVFII